MSSDIERAYDRSPYPDYAFWATHPDHLGMFGRLFGLAAADPDHCSVLEIGCAVGGNLIPMALASPGSRFVGIDLSQVQIERARATAAALDADNVTFFQGDFRSLPSDLGPFDYVVCHGVFAWVTPETQGALLTFIRERLAPNGVAFVSYNIYPGQHMVDMVRKLIRVHTVNVPDIATRDQQSMAMLRFMHRQSTRNAGDWRQGFFEQELRKIAGDDPSLFEHDYFAVESHPVYFVDFVGTAVRSGLAYLADSNPWLMYLDNQPAELVKTLAPLEDLVLQGQYLDFIHHNRYRETLLCRADAPLSRDVGAARILDMHVAHALAREPSLTGLAERLTVEIQLPRGNSIAVSHPILRLALHRLWQHGRGAPSLRQLARELEHDLAAHGIDEPGGEALVERLATQLLRAFFANAVRLSLRPTPVASSVPERPTTGRYQRHQAALGRGSITNLIHETYEATPAMRALLPLMDGTRTIDDLRSAWDEPIEGPLMLLVRTGFVLDPASAAMRR